jgi:hypothetical protein
MHDYSNCYAILGVRPDTDWGTLRANYRRLIGRWHPDRFSGDTVRREMAEERSKQITLAYRALEKYRRDNGVLPPTNPVAIAVDAQGPAQKADPAPGRASFKTYGEAGTKGATVRPPVRRRPGRRVAIALCALVAALYLAPYLDVPARRDQLADSARDRDVATPSPLVVENLRELRGISPGSTLGEVYAIQGVPTVTQGDTWQYGKSRIRFAEGRVISWSEHPDNALQIARDQTVQLHEGYFAVGSTKNQVREIQGTPVRETDTIWDYAPSRVFFEHDRVIRWEESPLRPLHVRR